MDLNFLDAAPSEAERAAVDELLGPPHPDPRGRGLLGNEGEEIASHQTSPNGHDDGKGRAAGHGFAPFDARSATNVHAPASMHGVGVKRHMLLPALHAVNDRVGWISQGALNYICERLEVPPADAYGVATFYALFAVQPRPARVVHVCTDIACKAAGADKICQGLQERLGAAGQGEDFTWQESPCLGMCERAPAALAIQAGDPHEERVVGPTTAEAVAAIAERGLDAAAPEPPAGAAVPQAGDPQLRLLRRVGVVDPTSLADYRANGGYAALRQALALGPNGVIRELMDSKLVGRGGAAFPMGRKWDAVARQPDLPHYLVCNADESEPGTFKDRVLMEGDPFSLIEAMTIGGFTTGCEHGIIYIRGEYPRALAMLQNAIDEARKWHLLGPNVMGFGFSFDIEIRRGAGAYICGEETALFASVEGYRGEPRTKPPFPVEKGLFGKPTLENNVETLVNVLPVLLEGGRAYASVGTEMSTGTKLFCVSGAVERPGIYELPFGATLGELLELAGRRGDRPLQAVLVGGAAGSFVRGDELDIPLTFEGTRANGTTLGSGVIFAVDESIDMGGIILRIAEFFRDESCGQCVPCRVGTVRQEEALARLSSGRPLGSSAQDLELLREVGRAMRDASICGLGQTAWDAVESAINRLDLFKEATQS